MAVKLAKKNTKVQKVIKKPRVEATSKARKGGQAEADLLPLPTGQFTEGIGRRKVATARVRLYHTPGDFIVNGKAAGQYFDTIVNAQNRYNLPFMLTDMKNKFTVSIKVSGSGVQSQLTAAIHGISRALIKFNPEFKTLLKEHNLLTRDDRMKETRKIGTGGKARRKRQSPKR
jgi:small subunit ribosomal protein S9